MPNNKPKANVYPFAKILDSLNTLARTKYTAQ